MKKILTIAMLTACAVLAQDPAEPNALTLARERYQKDLKVAQDQVTKAYVAKLENLYASVKDKPDKNPSIAVATEIEEMKATVGTSKEPIVGNWMWMGKMHVEFCADGTVTTADGNKGTWKVVDRSKRVYETAFITNGTTHRLILSKDGKSLAGKELKGTNNGLEFSVNRAK
jgi:hypothetical protein